MKKMYSAPVMEVEKFDVADAILATSTMATEENYNKIKNATDNNSDGTNYEVVIKSQW